MFGIAGAIVDGNDVLASYRAVKEAIDRARSGGGATLIEAKTYRPVPHSSDDDDRTYRTREEVEEWKKKDPVLNMRKYLESVGLLDEKKTQEYEARAKEVVDDANQFGKNAPYPPVEAALEQVWGERPA
jgi:2-oxoisovalerate dehydrogenase E1 component alpha subunit